MSAGCGILKRERTPAVMELETSFICAYCFSVNEIIVDATGGLLQKYTEDCQVCCRPNRLTIVVEGDFSGAEATAEPE
jgi:hypothetical protein